MLNPIQRLDHEEALLTLIAECINLGHPLKERMAQVNVRQAMALSDDRLTGMSDRLTVWLVAARSARDVAASEGVLAAPAEVG